MFCAMSFQAGTAKTALLPGVGSKTTKLKTPTVVLIYLFTVFRVLFAVLYAYKIQPWRSLCFVFGQLCILGLGLIAIIGAGQLAPED